MRGFFKGLVDRATGKAPAKTASHPVAVPVQKFPSARPAAKPVATPADLNLGRGEFPTGQRTDIPALHTMVSAFLAGTRANLTSSWLKSMKYDRSRSELQVTFLDGASVTVEDISESEATRFYEAPSKGGAYWDIVLGPNYQRGQPNTALKRWR